MQSGKCSHEHMAFTFQIRPLLFEKGYELSCDGVLPERVRHGHLLHALVQAAQTGRALAADVQIFDDRGELMETLPLGSPKRLHRALRACGV